MTLEPNHRQGGPPIDEKLIDTRIRRPARLVFTVSPDVARARPGGPAPRLTFLRRLGRDLPAATAGARSAVAESGKQILHRRLPPRLNLELPVLG
jgi:hypothetical protein